ncbi:MAG: inorganic phosphate transporter [Deltaproteobacteria bacterium]|nr:MAG: inorganic phosphate transporter [Deltaproteobacteria bacterium]
MDHSLILTGLAVAFGFYMAWNIGANDVANAMGTSVGSGALTLKRAVIVAGVLEFAGAFLVGSHVANTVRKGIVNPEIFMGDPTVFVLGMLAALLAAGAWLQIASYCGWPVSTTHSIVGAIVGFGLLVGGAQAVNWGKVISIAASWVISPLISATISFFIFLLLRKKIFRSATPVAAAKRLTPVLVFFVFAILTLVMVFKGLKNLHLHLSFFQALIAATAVGFVAALLSVFWVSRLKLSENSINLNHTENPADIKAMGVPHSRNTVGRGKNKYQDVEKIFVYLQILSACFVAFAHGANDVANAIGPLAAVVSVIKTGVVGLKATVPLWALVLGGIGIVFGLATWGWRVIETVGKKITELTPSRGFSATFGAAVTVVVASRLGLPISTTHTLVGAVMGVGLARGIEALNLNAIRDIVLSWVITIPAGAVFAIGIYYLLTLFYL